MASGRWWGIITSIFIHSSFSHLLSNMALFLILATPLEHSYGTARIFVVWLVAGLAGSLASAAWEAPCSLVVGASGAVFGFVGLYIADIALNFESMVLPLARLAAMVVGLVFLIVLQVVDSRSGNKATSHMSHVGGFIAGLCVSFLFLPNFKDRRWVVGRAGREHCVCLLCLPWLKSCTVPWRMHRSARARARQVVSHQDRARLAWCIT
jgi:membrane associated rhomboid family serine protease